MLVNRVWSVVTPRKPYQASGRLLMAAEGSISSVFLLYLSCVESSALSLVDPITSKWIPGLFS